MAVHAATNQRQPRRTGARTQRRTITRALASPAPSAHIRWRTTSPKTTAGDKRNAHRALRALIRRAAVDYTAPRHVPRGYRWNQVERLLATAPPPARASSTPAIHLRDQAIIEVCAATGAITPDLAALTMGDFEPATATLDVGGHPVPLTPAAVAALTAYLQTGRPALLGSTQTDALFVTRTHRPMTQRMLCMAIAARKNAARLPRGGSVAIRQALGAALSENGAGPEVIAVLLRYKTITGPARFRLTHVADNLALVTRALRNARNPQYSGLTEGPE